MINEMNGLMRRASLVKSFGSQRGGDGEGDFAKIWSRELNKMLLRHRILET